MIRWAAWAPTGSRENPEDKIATGTSTAPPTAGLPFSALVGLEQEQQALLLLAVEPRLRGMMIAAAAGTGKSTLARGMAYLCAADGRPFVEIPASIDAENLLGGLDLEATLRKGEMVIQPGILAQAHHGAAYVDGVNLLTDASSNILLSAIDQEEVRVEREGISLRSEASFSLIGSYDPEEGLPRKHLLDRVGLLVTLPAHFDAAKRTAVIHHNLLPNTEESTDDLAFLHGLVQTAREQLPHVKITPHQLRQLSITALQYGVEGHRVDLFAARAACAAAALELRDTVEDEDLVLAARLVILPRATQRPAPEETPPPPPPPPPEPESADSEESDEDGEGTPPQTLAIPPEQIFAALESELPENLETLPFTHLRRGRAGSRGSTDGKRGRHVRSIPGNPQRARIDVTATLRAAAPWQRIRRAETAVSHKNLYLQLSDVRVKQYRSKAGALFCFAVDASGSMALHRMRQAKGAVNALLQKAYVNRDRVALIAFRGPEAELLLPPSQSVELARRALDHLPTGGGTPLASALLLADDVARQAKSRGILQVVLIILTDGRANVPFRADSKPQEELQQIGGYVANSPMHVVVVDTQRSYLSRGEARKLAEWLGGEYAYLPNATSEQIADVATAVVDK